MSGLAIVAFCAAIGFVVAGAVSSLYQLLTSEAADFLISKKTFAGVAVVAVTSLFGGPVIITRKVVAAVRARALGPLPAMLGLAVSALWSVCAGVLIVHLMVQV